MITKNQILEAIKAMPENEFVDAEPVIEEIILLEKIKKGIEATEKGEVLSENEVDNLIDEW